MGTNNEVLRKLHFEGHFGLTLICLTPIFLLLNILFIPMEISITIILMSAFLSCLPDLDIPLGLKHRGITHNIPFTLLFSFLIAIIAIFVVKATLLVALSTFITLMLAFLIHIFGDLFTFVKIKIFYPLSKKEYGGWEKFRADDKKVNQYLFIGGIIIFVISVAFIMT